MAYKGKALNFTSHGRGLWCLLSCFSWCDGGRTLAIPFKLNWEICGALKLNTCSGCWLLSVWEGWRCWSNQRTGWIVFNLNWGSCSAFNIRECFGSRRCCWTGQGSFHLGPCWVFKTRQPTNWPRRLQLGSVDQPDRQVHLWWGLGSLLHQNIPLLPYSLSHYPLFSPLWILIPLCDYHNCHWHSVQQGGICYDAECPLLKLWCLMLHCGYLFPFLEQNMEPLCLLVHLVYSFLFLEDKRSDKFSSLLPEDSCSLPNSGKLIFLLINV